MKRPLLPAFAALLLAATLVPSSAVVRRHDRPDTAYRALAARPAFSCVGRVEVDGGRGFQGWGTATLIAPDRLISAAHVFEPRDLRSLKGMRVTFPNGRVVPINFRRPGVIQIPARYDSQRLHHDLAVIFLEESVDIRPALLYRGPRLRLGRALTFIGYGNTGNGFTFELSSETKRAGRNDLDAFLRRGTLFEIDHDHPTRDDVNSLGSPRPRFLEAILGSGDSGGPVWVRTRGGWRLVGINSSGRDEYDAPPFTSDVSYGDVSSFVYVPHYRKWLLGALSLSPESPQP